MQLAQGDQHGGEDEDQGRGGREEKTADREVQRATEETAVRGRFLYNFSFKYFFILNFMTNTRSNRKNFSHEFGSSKILNADKILIKIVVINLLFKFEQVLEFFNFSY